MDVYARLGFPGAWGSMDATHVWWNQCPVSFSNLCTGKEGYPTLTFNCIVDHYRYIQYTSIAYYGSIPDIAIAQMDELPRRLMCGVMSSVVFFIFLASGLLVKCFGAYLICDAGYPKSSCFIYPLHHRLSRQHILWSEWLESVRKDVECTFAILKQRFRFLKNPIDYHDKHIVESAFHTCCIVHNLILCYEGRDITGIIDTEDWEVLDPDGEVIEEEANDIAVTVDDEILPVGCFKGLLVDHSVEMVYGMTDISKLMEDLVISFERQYSKGLLMWPKSMTDKDRKRLPALISRSNREVSACLDARPSSIYVKHSDDEYRILDGDGLYATIEFKKDDVIAEYNGEIIGYHQLIERQNLNIANYIIHFRSPTFKNDILVNDGKYMDCKVNRENGTCKASLANSSVGAKIKMDDGNLVPAKANARISTDRNGTKAKLIATEDIKRNIEILTCYFV